MLEGRRVHVRTGEAFGMKFVGNITALELGPHHGLGGSPTHVTLTIESHVMQLKVTMPQTKFKELLEPGSGILNEEVSVDLQGVTR